MHECPEFDEKGVCNDTKCKLPHIERAGRRRAAATAAEKAKKQESGSSSKNASSEDDEEDEEEDNDNEASDVDSDFLDDDVNFVGYVEDSQADGAGGGMLGDFVKF